jgi:hypothetical protein
MNRKATSFKNMKLTCKIFMAAAIFLMVFDSSQLFGQKKITSLRYQNAIWQVWSIEANAGFLSSYGDLSNHDNQFIKKLKYESCPSLSLNISKHFGRLLAISGQVLTGKLKGSNSNSSFDASILEYNLNLKFNLFNLFYPGNNGKFGITTFAGAGQFLFSSTKTDYLEGEDKITHQGARVPEFVFLAGAGAFIKTTERFGISIDYSLRQCQNDKLDVEVKNDDFDYYTYLSLGLTYYIDRFNKSPMKNKARIAHNNSRK